tara:strand:+ start:37 stop:597 length:561 start_codon:yes stop_codon:yes gene_type:complete
MTIADWLMIFAVLSGPVIAVQLTRYLDAKKITKQRKVAIFKTLMATRSYTVSWNHVESLNNIDLEFDAKKTNEKAVIEAWKEYLDLLNNSTMPIEQWGIKRIELLVQLLHEMAKVLKYDFDKTHIKNSSYSPRIHGDTEDQQAAIRKGLLEVLDGTRSIPMEVINLNQPVSANKALKGDAEKAGAL